MDVRNEGVDRWTDWRAASVDEHDSKTTTTARPTTKYSAGAWEKKSLRAKRQDEARRQATFAAKNIETRHAKTNDADDGDDERR